MLFLLSLDLLGHSWNSYFSLFFTYCSFFDLQLHNFAISSVARPSAVLTFSRVVTNYFWTSHLYVKNILFFSNFRAYFLKGHNLRIIIWRVNINDIQRNKEVNDFGHWKPFVGYITRHFVLSFYEMKTFLSCDFAHFWIIFISVSYDLGWDAKDWKAKMDVRR